jgi:hypothetical protein
VPTRVAGRAAKSGNVGVGRDTPWVEGQAVEASHCIAAAVSMAKQVTQDETGSRRRWVEDRGDRGRQTLEWQCGERRVKLAQLKRPIRQEPTDPPANPRQWKVDDEKG